MRWRDILIGAVVTLAVTVIAGLFVWYLTREPPLAPRATKLEYTIDSVTYFENTPSQIEFVTFKLGSVGTDIASDVRIVLEFPRGINISEKQIVFSSGHASTYTENKSEPHIIDLSLPSLVPDEFFTVAILNTSSWRSEPKISIKSKETVGTPGLIEKGASVLPEPGIKGFTILLIVVAALVLQMIGIRVIIPRLKSNISSINNTAFLFIQKKLTDEASALLDERIKTKGSNPISLANHALVVGLQGNLDGAERRFFVAEWWHSGKHQLAVIKFNRATLMIANEDYETAKKYLMEAFSLSRKEISRYCHVSEYIADAMQANAEIKDLVTNNGRVNT